MHGGCIMVLVWTAVVTGGPGLQVAGARPCSRCVTADASPAAAVSRSAPAAAQWLPSAAATAGAAAGATQAQPAPQHAECGKVSLQLLPGRCRQRLAAFTAGSLAQDGNAVMLTVLAHRGAGRTFQSRLGMDLRPVLHMSLP